MELQEVIEEVVGIEPESPAVEHTVYELFKWSLLLKGAISIAEVIAGVVLLLLPATLVVHTVEQLRAGIAPSNSYGFLLEHLLSEIDAFSASAVLFISLYLLARGSIKLLLIWALLKNKVWAYPASLTVLGLFLVYQLYQMLTGHSIFIVAISIFDLIVMYLIWREWKIVRRHNAELAAASTV